MQANIAALADINPSLDKFKRKATNDGDSILWFGVSRNSTKFSMDLRCGVATNSHWVKS